MQADTYAKAILELEKEGKNTDSVVKGLFNSLKKRGAISLLPKILSAYNKLLARIDTKSAKLTVARKEDVSTALQESGAPEDIKIEIDEELIGGYRLERDGKLLDNSFKAKLLQAYRNATKA